MQLPSCGRSDFRLVDSTETEIAGHNSIEFRRHNSEGETPGPIPNPEAKPFSADGTALVTGWESRTPPDIFTKGLPRIRRAFRISGEGFRRCPSDLASRTEIAGPTAPSVRAELTAQAGPSVQLGHSVPVRRPGPPRARSADPTESADPTATSLVDRGSPNLPFPTM